MWRPWIAAARSLMVTEQDTPGDTRVRTADVRGSACMLTARSPRVGPYRWALRVATLHTRYAAGCKVDVA